MKEEFSRLKEREGIPGIENSRKVPEMRKYRTVEEINNKMLFVSNVVFFYLKCISSLTCVCV